MSTFTGPDGEPATEAEFERSLSELIQAAVANDVEVRGGWRVELADDPGEYGVEVHRVVRSTA